MATPLPCRAIQAPSQPESSIGCAPTHRTPLWLLNVSHPYACSTDRFLDAQLGDLCALQRRIRRIGRRLEQRIADCQDKGIHIDVFIAPILVDSFVQVQQLQEKMNKVIYDQRQSLTRAQASRQRLLSTQGKA